MKSYSEFLLSEASRMSGGGPSYVDPRDPVSSRGIIGKAAGAVGKLGLSVATRGVGKAATYIGGMVAKKAASTLTKTP